MDKMPAKLHFDWTVGSFWILDGNFALKPEVNMTLAIPHLLTSTPKPFERSVLESGAGEDIFELRLALLTEKSRQITGPPDSTSEWKWHADLH